MPIEVSSQTGACDQEEFHALSTSGWSLFGAHFCSIVLGSFLLCRSCCQAAESAAVVHCQPLHDGRLSPRLFGNFVELLDDVVPGMWAEMLNDRSFEGVVPAANWSYYDGKPNFCDQEWETNSSWCYDTEKPFNGARSARLMATRDRPATLTQSGLAVKRARGYEFSGWFRSTSPRLRAAVHLKVLLPTGEWMTLVSAGLPHFSTQWSRHSARLVSKGESDRVVFELRVEGEGQVWADKLSLMPSDDLLGWRPDVVQAVKDVHPAIVRWGGSTCDPGGYLWKQGIGDRDHRTPFRNKVWGRIDSNDVGIDEFCQFCELTGVEPLICVSFADGPQSAGELVAYCNAETGTFWGDARAANGHPAPYHVQFWQVGNEISGDDENYLKQIVDFVRLMKAADPAVRLMSSFPSRKLLVRAGQDLAYVCPHHYTPDLAACDRDLAGISRLLAETPGCARTKIAVTEWNVTGSDWGLGRAKMLTLDSALLNARYLHVLMRHSDAVEIACRSNLANSYAGAIIETSPADLLKRPSFYAMQLYARHAKPIPLRLDPSNNALDLFACAAADQRSLCLFAINPGTEPVQFSYRFDGFAGPVSESRAEVLCDTRDARQRDVMNHWEAPERVKIVPLPTPHSPVMLPALSVTAVEYESK